MNAEEMKALEEQRNKAGTALKSAIAEFQKTGKHENDEKRSEFARIEKEYDDLRKQCDNAYAEMQEAKRVSDRLASLDADENQSRSHGLVVPGREDSSRKGALDAGGADDAVDLPIAWRGFLTKPEKRTEKQVESMRRYGLNRLTTELDINIKHGREYAKFVNECRGREPGWEARSMSAFNLATGGALIGVTLASSLEKNMLAFGGLRPLASTIVTAHGDEFRLPGADDTGNMGTILGEGGAINLNDPDPAFNIQTWRAHKYSSRPFVISHELLEDDLYDIEGAVAEMAGERIGRITEQHFMNGNGVSQPSGLLGDSATGVTAASATAFTWQELLSLAYSVNKAYRDKKTDTTGFMMNDSQVSYVRMFADGMNQPLWQVSLRTGVPDTFHGWPVFTSMEMPATRTAGASTVLFGDFSRYVIRRVRGIRVYTMEERYRDQDMIGIVAFVREDGRLKTVSRTNTPVKKLVQAP